MTLHKALSRVVSDGLVLRNAAQVKAPRPEKSEIKALSPDRACKLVTTAYATGDRYAALYVVALHTEMREGEMLGFQWDDLDLDATTPTPWVRRTLSETRTGHRFELPRSGKGRSVKLSKKAVDPLRSYRAKQVEETLRLGSLWQYHRLMFPTTTGTITSGRNLLGRYFKPLLKKAGLPAIRLHDLRHTCATILLMAGKHPRHVKEMFGHPSIGVTLDTYSHVIESMGDGLAGATGGAP